MHGCLLSDCKVHTQQVLEKQKKINILELEIGEILKKKGSKNSTGEGTKIQFEDFIFFKSFVAPIVN